MKQFPLKSALLLTFAIVIFSFKPFYAKVNMSGEWKLNETKSELGDFGKRFAAKVIKIEQKDDAITISKTSTNFQGETVTSSETLKYDGTVSETPAFGDSKKLSTAKWSEDGQSLGINTTVKFERDGQTNEFKGAETWSMKDGMLSVVTVSNGPRGETTTKALYDK